MPKLLYRDAGRRFGCWHVVLVDYFFGCAGQSWLSGSVWVCFEDVSDKFFERFLASTKKFKVGNGLDEFTIMGPVISAAPNERVLGFIGKSIQGDAE